ncbi:MAG TPA: hypothetical protein VJP77_05740 [Planctomycetota bacterium]|nr:hypothetical protein [Planctomycetota bacterium]
MTNERTDLATRADIPAYLAKTKAEGLDVLAEYQQLQRLKVVQGMTDADLRREFPVGSLVLSPERSLVAKPREAVEASLLYFWPSWEKWADMTDTEQGGRPLASSLDPTSDVARKAKDFERRKEAYADNTDKRQRFYRFVESLNFALMIDTGPAAGAVAVLPYNKGSHKFGARLCGYLKRRAVAVYANRIELVTKELPSPVGQGSYEVVDWRGAERPFAAEERLALLKATFDGFEKAHGARTLEYAQETPDDDDGAMGDDTKS